MMGEYWFRVSAMRAVDRAMLDIDRAGGDITRWDWCVTRHGAFTGRMGGAVIPMSEW
jgi:hypothetical protein